VSELRPHWSALGWAVPAPAVAAGAVAAVVVAWPQGPVDVVWVLLGVLALSALWLAARVLRRRATCVVVTSARLVRRSGILGRRGLDIRLERINEVSYQQSLVERVIGSGNLMVEMGGERGVVVFDHMRRPASVAALLQEQVTRRTRNIAVRGPSAPGAGPGDDRPPGSPVTLGSAGFDATPPSGTAAVRLRAGAQTSGGAAGSVAERLVQLDELHRRGLLSEAEYEAKRASLIDRL